MSGPDLTGAGPIGAATARATPMAMAVGAAAGIADRFSAPRVA
jgi:hypothetical protein